MSMNALQRRILPVKIIAAMATYCILFAAGASRAAVVDFESLEHADDQVVSHGSVYTEDGFTVTALVGNLLSNGTLRTNFSGSTAIYNGFPDGRQQIASTGGATFGLLSIDLTELNVTQPTVIFTGQLASDDTVTQSFTLDGVAFDPQTFVFDPSFQDLVAVEFAPGAPTSDQAFQYDNIVIGGVTPVKMLSFTASLNSEGVLLQWETSFESNHAGFHVFRRAVGASWEKITDQLIVEGPMYSYSDPSPVAGYRYQYEIESWSRTGETERFGPVEIQIPLVTGITLRAAPNPSLGATSIYYALPKASRVTVRVFDLSGRLVRVLVDSFQGAGQHEMNWNAEDESGRPLPAGIYFVKLDTEAGSRVQRLAIVR
jgi:hypothetical protein